MSRHPRNVEVMVVDGPFRKPLPHLMYHSPDGFNWGYGGSGPADLARSIVGDVLGQVDPNPMEYQHVKIDLVATLPEKGGVITEDQVREVLGR